MKFHISASIAIYCLFTLFWMTLPTYTTEEKNTKIIPNLDSIITPDLQQQVGFLHGIKKQIFTLQEKYGENTKLNISSVQMQRALISSELQENFTNRLQFFNQIKQQIHSLQQKLPIYKLLHSISKNIISQIVNQFLTIHDILILRETCTYFRILILSNNENMVMFCKDFHTKQMDEVPLIWFDLKYFLNQSYTNALDKMEIYNIKEKRYAILTRRHDLISWYNTLTPYPKIIFNKTKNELNEKNIHSCNLLTLQYEQDKIYNKIWGSAWAQITNKGTIVTSRDYVQENVSNQIQSLKNVKTIISTDGAFSALSDDGHVVAWGDENFGGRILAETKTQLKNVKMIFSNFQAFAALLNDGSVLAWGSPYHGGKIPDETQAQLQNVKMIFSTFGAFAALLNDGCVVAWGVKREGGYISDKIYKQLRNVKMIFSTYNAFAALLNDDNVVTWGDEDHGGKIPETIQPQLQNQKLTLCCTCGAFVALLHDNSVVAWGNKFMGGQIPVDIHTKLTQNVKIIFNTDAAFAALLNDGSVLAWGMDIFGGKIPHFIQNQLKNVKMVFSTEAAFAALLNDGSVFAWGDDMFGGEIPTDLQKKLMKSVKMIFPHKLGFTAVCKNGELIEWGEN